MPIDPTIATSGVQLNPMQSLASMLDVQAKHQQVQGNSISLKERQNLQRVMSDPSQFMDSDGRIDFNKALPLIMRAAPTTGMEHVHALVDAQSKATASQQAINAQTDENRGRIGQVLWGIQEDATPDVVHKTIDTLGQQYKGMDLPISLLKQEYDAAYKQGGAKAAAQVLKGAAQHVLPQPTQQTMATGQVSAIPTAGGTQLIQTAQGAEQPQGAPIGQPFTPPNQIVSTPNGSAGVANTATGTVTPMKAPEMVTYYPPGESADTVKALQDQRTSQQQQLQSLPERQNIYKNIIDLADKGTPTGMYGSLWQRFGSMTGYHFTGDDTADRNALGKWLEQEAARNAQAMGVHTNAGLESSKAQGGTPEYDNKTIAHIARTGAANAQGVMLYNQGLELAMRAYQQQHPGTDPVIAKRQFDSQWAKTYDVQAMRLKQAVDSGDKNGVNEVIREVGGPGSANARKLLSKVHAINQLSGEQ